MCHRSACGAENGIGKLVGEFDKILIYQLDKYHEIRLVLTHPFIGAGRKMAWRMQLPGQRPGEAADNNQQLMEDAMKSSILIKDKVQIDYADEVMRFTLKVGAVACALIGVWAFTCLIAGLADVGPVELVRGYISAVTGR